MEITGPLLVQVSTNPLGLLLTIKIEDEPQHFFQPLDIISGQLLALSILAQVGREMKPELVKLIQAEYAARAAQDEQFLKTCGVAGNN